MIKLLENSPQETPMLIADHRRVAFGIEASTPLIRKGENYINADEIIFPSPYIAEQWTKRGGVLRNIFKEVLIELGDDASLIEIKELFDEKVRNSINRIM